MNATKSRIQALTTVIIVLCILLISVFIIYMLREIYFSSQAAEPTPPPIPSEAPSAPPDIAENAEPSEPVETRQYIINFSPTENAAINASIESIINAAKDSFNEAYDISSGQTLYVNVELSPADTVCGAAITVNRSDGGTVETHVYSLEDGHEMSGEELYGEGYREYLRDYFETNLPKMEGFSELLSPEYLSYTANDAANYNSFLPNADGSADFLFAPATIINSDEHIRLQVGVDVLSGQYYNRRIVDPAKPMVCLTFDDGPHETYTDQILDILEEYGAVATFFEVGQNVDEYPEPVKRAYDLGCEIASHTYVHRNLAHSSEEQLRRDKELCDEAFTNAIGVVPTLIRPPEGSMSIAAKNYYDQIFIGWSVDTLDWYTKNTWSTVNCVQTFGDLDGQVILMHSLYSTTVEAVRQLVPWLIEKGYQLVTIDEMFEYGYGITPEQHTYYAYDYYIHGRPEPVLPEEAEIAET